jgi:hypothetical protein
MRDTFAVLSEPYGGEAMEKSSVCEWHKWFKENLLVEITNEDNAHHFHIKGIVHFEFISQSQTVNQPYVKILEVVT